MHKPLSSDELVELQKDYPVDEAPAAPPKLTRRQKLERLATLVERYPGPVELNHNLERRSDHELAGHYPRGALNLAAGDEVFKKDGLAGTREMLSGAKVVSTLDVRNYLELTTRELHEFSCDCGGLISNAKMAERIRNLGNGNGSNENPGMFTRFAGAFGF